MAFPQMTVIAVDTANDPKLLFPIHHLDFLADAEIHLVHVVRRVNYGDGLSFNVTFPLFEDQTLIEDAVLNKMQNMAKDILPPWHTGKVQYQCLIGDDPKEEFCKYLLSVDADLAIVGAREKHGLFQGSFSYYVGTHSHCSVFVIR